MQQPAYLRTTATILARLDYAALAQGFGVAYQEIACDGPTGRRHPRGPVLSRGRCWSRVVTDYGKRPIRWIDAVRKKFTKELTFDQKARFLARAGTRAVFRKDEMSD